MKHDTSKNKEKVLENLEKCLGIVSKACKMSNISRVTFYDWCKYDPEFKAAVDEIDNATLDFVESRLLDKVGEGDTRAIAFYMKYKGRKRGYVESFDVNQNVDGKINVNITFDEKKED
jgi:hypothetical protein